MAVPAALTAGGLTVVTETNKTLFNYLKLNFDGQ